MRLLPEAAPYFFTVQLYWSPQGDAGKPYYPLRKNMTRRNTPYPPTRKHVLVCAGVYLFLVLAIHLFPVAGGSNSPLQASARPGGKNVIRRGMGESPSLETVTPLPLKNPGQETEGAKALAKSLGSMLVFGGVNLDTCFFAFFLRGHFAEAKISPRCIDVGSTCCPSGRARWL